MTTEQWFEKFAELREGDWVNFGGLRLKVYHIMFWGGCLFSGMGGEVFHATSEAWETAVIEGKETYWVEAQDDEKDSANWWKE